MNLVYFDLETQRSIRDVGGIKNAAKLGVSIAVTYSTERGSYMIYGEDQMDELIDELIKADRVIGWNHLHFDLPVLEGYTVYDLASQTYNLDMMADLEKKVGARIGLNSAASATLEMGKTAVGTDALIWWQDYKKSGDKSHLMKIAEYCAFDVKVTKAVHEYAVEHGRIKYTARGNDAEILEVEVDWEVK